ARGRRASVRHENPAGNRPVRGGRRRELQHDSRLIRRIHVQLAAESRDGWTEWSRRLECEVTRTDPRRLEGRKVEPRNPREIERPRNWIGREASGFLDLGHTGLARQQAVDADQRSDVEAVAIDGPA